MGISIRAYARHRGVSNTAVHKAIKTGRITLEPDATLDPAKADQQWAENTNPIRGESQYKKAASTTLNTDKESLGENTHSPDHRNYMKLKMLNETLKAKLANLKLSKEKGEVIDKAKAIATVFRLARTERDVWLNWPAQVSAKMASELKIDSHKLQIALDSYVRAHLNELADIKPQFD